MTPSRSYLTGACLAALLLCELLGCALTLRSLCCRPTNMPSVLPSGEVQRISTHVSLQVDTQEVHFSVGLATIASALGYAPSYAPSLTDADIDTVLQAISFAVEGTLPPGVAPGGVSSDRTTSAAGTALSIASRRCPMRC